MPLENNPKNTYASIIQGKIAVQADENDPNAKKREWESADGKSSGVKYEIYYDNLRGIINKLTFKDTDFGTFINIEIDGITLSINTESGKTYPE